MNVKEGIIIRDTGYSTTTMNINEGVIIRDMYLNMAINSYALWLMIKYLFLCRLDQIVYTPSWHPSVIRAQAMQTYTVRFLYKNGLLSIWKANVSIELYIYIYRGVFIYNIYGHYHLWINGGKIYLFCLNIVIMCIYIYLSCGLFQECNPKIIFIHINAAKFITV